jgi:hypothetical protein
MTKIKLLISMQILFLTVAFFQIQVFVGAGKVNSIQEEQYYGIEDFVSVKKFDIHIHI